MPYVQDRGGAQQTASNEQLQTITAEDVAAAARHDAGGEDAAHALKMYCLTKAVPGEAPKTIMKMKGFSKDSNGRTDRYMPRRG